MVYIIELAQAGVFKEGEIEEELLKKISLTDCPYPFPVPERGR